MKYGFTRSWAIVNVTLGYLIISAGILVPVVLIIVGSAGSLAEVIFGRVTAQTSATIVLWGSLTVLGLGVLGGLVLGTPFVLAGQLVLILLDRRRLLVAQYRLLRRIREGLEARDRGGVVGGESSRTLDRLRPRR
jgi:hypothetical protein